MARLRHTARKSVIPFLPSRLAERPLRRPVAGQSSHLERLHHRLHEEQQRRRQEQQGSSFSLQQEIESVRSCSPVLPLEAPPAPSLGAPASGVAAGGDPDDGGGDSRSWGAQWWCRGRLQRKHRGAAPHRLYLLLERERRALLLLSSTFLLLTQAVV